MYTPFKIEWRVITLKKNYCFYCEPEEIEYLKRCLRDYRNGQNNEADFHSKLNEKVDLTNAMLKQALDTLDYLLVTRDSIQN